MNVVFNSLFSFFIKSRIWSPFFESRFAVGSSAKIIGAFVDNALAIAMNPNTGEVLGMSSRPNYDPNNYNNYNAETINRNLPIWMTYEPGSTFKNVNTI